MPRIVTWRMLLAAMAIGPVLTVLVAWGCIAWMPCTDGFEPFEYGAESAALAPDEADPDGGRSVFRWQSGTGWREMKSLGTAAFWAKDWWTPVHRFAGWPAPAMWSRVELQDTHWLDENETSPVLRYRWALSWKEILHRGLATQDLPKWMRAESNRRLPLIPIWLGFLVDTVGYGAISLGILAAFRFAKLRRRWRAGMCLGCGYDLFGHSAERPMCPECGLRLPRQKGEQLL